MPRRAKARTAAPQPSELQIHIAVAQHLKYRARKGIVWWHTPSEGKRTKAEAAKQKALGLVAGIPDLVLIANGKTYGLELKTFKGRISPEQKSMLSQFEAAGAYVAVAYGLDAAIFILTSWGLIGQPMAQAA